MHVTKHQRFIPISLCKMDCSLIIQLITQSSRKLTRFCRKKRKNAILYGSWVQSVTKILQIVVLPELRYVVILEIKLISLKIKIQFTLPKCRVAA